MERPRVETYMRQAAALILLTASLLTVPASSLDQLWSFLSSVWVPATTDEGCGLDPDGGCQPAPTIDAGCGLDPDGKPACQQGS